MNFPIADDVRELLEVLRETGFNWVADEIQAVIKEGKTVDKIVKTGNRRIDQSTVESASLPFSSDEQLAIALASIREYTINAAQLLGSLQSEVAEPLNRRDIHIQLVSDEEQPSVLLDLASDLPDRLPSEEAKKALLLLDQQLEEAWPTAQGIYGLRVKDHERIVE